MRKIKLIIMFLLMGAVLDILLVGSLAHMIIFYQQYQFEAPPHLMDYFKNQPMNAFTSLFNGEASTYFMHQVLQGIYWIVFLFLLIRAFFGKEREFAKRNADDYGSHGTARWATDKELQRLYNDKGMIVGEHKKKPLIQPVDGENNHMTLVYGGSGSGKTAGYSIPNILHISKTLQESFVITDPKGDIYKATRNHLKQQGYDVITVNLIDMTRSQGYNPMDYIDKGNDSMSLATTIMKNTGAEGKSQDSMWEHAEHALLSALIQFLKETRPKHEQHLKNVLHLGNMIKRRPKDIDKMFNDLSDDSTARHLYNIFANSEDKTRAGILIGFASRLRLWTLEDVAQLTSKSDFNIHQLGQKKTALFILTPDGESTYDMLTAMLIDQIFQELIKQAAQNDSKHLNVPVRMILDEVANIAPISDLKKRVGVMRARGVRITLMFQGIQQFKNRYGEGSAAEISDSCDNVIVMAANDPSSSVPISKKIGNTTLMISSQSRSSNGRGGSTGESYSFTGSSLMNPDQIENMPKDKCILFQNGRPPAYVNKYFYFKHDWQIAEHDWTKDSKRYYDQIRLFNPPKVQKKKEPEPEKETEEEEVLFKD
ncbi:VirD4-like conjugal transfer protein, CD1115 family [Halobacillus massiliensis]|uniref:VirD4-like conjugal transfer protein, CD1115 family n=1 Tax=Halobacillus massiliensis TaxID=1926286 RepID=UPI0009E37C22|nr:type IV secretory system conjugative DNA transfer family protein [Halobacillus massiliensis]